MEKRTAELTPGEWKQLLVTVLQGVPPDLPPELVREHIGKGKRSLHAVMHAVLHSPLGQIDASELFGALGTPIRFSDETRRALVQAGYTIVEVPGLLTAPVTLSRLYHAQAVFEAKLDTGSYGDLTGAYIEQIELAAGQIAWMPKRPLIDESIGRTIAEQKEVVIKYSWRVQKQFGDRVMVIPPTLERAILVIFVHRLCKGEYPLPAWCTYTLNRFKLDHPFVVGCSIAGVKIFSVDPEDTFPDMGVLRLIVPKTA